nr:hypothetical protein [Pseudonocardia sp. H11422]
MRSSAGPALDMGWPLRSVSPVSEARGASPVNERTCLRLGNREATDDGDQGGGADAGQAGQAARQAGGVGLPVGVLAVRGVHGQLGGDRAQQPDLGGDLGGQIGERHRRIGPVELDRRRGRRPPGLGPLGALLPMRSLLDHAPKPGGSGGEQHARIGPPRQHRQVGRSEIPGQRGGRHQLPDQVLDPHLVLGRGPSQPVGGAHPPVQRRVMPVGQCQLAQPTGIDQRQPGQGVGVDAVALGVPRQEPTQVRGLRTRHPEHRVPAPGEEHRDRQPCRAGRLEHDLQPGPGRGASQGGVGDL